MDLAGRVRLADLEGLTAVEKCSGLSGRGLSELTLYNSGSREGRLGVHWTVREG